MYTKTIAVKIAVTANPTKNPIRSPPNRYAANIPAKETIKRPKPDKADEEVFFS